MATVISTTDVKAAKKAHVCNYCRGEIAEGSGYRSEQTVYEGEIYTWKSHFDCHDLAAEYNKIIGCDEGIPEMGEWEPDYLSENGQVLFAAIRDRAEMSVPALIVTASERGL